MNTKQICCGVALFVVGSSAQAAYFITDLGTLGGTYSQASDVNIHGDVVGSSTLINGETHAFLYRNGAIFDLGVLEARHNFSQAHGINNSGVIVGLSTNDGSNQGSRPFVFSNGTMSLVGSFGGNYGWANDINEAGQIVGISAYSNGVTHAFVKAFGLMIDLGSFSGTFDYSIAYGINDIGSVAGYSTISQSFSEAFLHHDGSLQNLGNLGGFSRGFAVNNSDQVTGASIVDAQGHEHAFLWHEGVMNDLGTTPGGLNSYGLDINNLGDVVGTLGLSDGNSGFLYHDGVMIDLNTLLPDNSGWVLRGAAAINDLGQIAGFGDINGEQHACLLTPVPEPATGFTLSIALLCGSVIYHRRRML